jgi:hypothetical protein
MVKEGAAAMNTEGIETPLCDACRRVPLSHLHLDVEPPIGGWLEFFRKRGVEVTDDHLGRPSVRRGVLGDLIDEHRERLVRLAAESAEKAAARTPPVAAGVPAREGLNAHETMLAQPDYTTLHDELGRPKPRFLEEALNEGRQHQLAERAAVKRRKEKKQ